MDYVVHGALPHGADVVVAAPQAADVPAVASVPIRPSKFLKEVRIIPGGGEDGFGDIDADGILFPLVEGMEASLCTRSRGGKASKYPVYDTAEEYLLEVPEDIRKMVAWYVQWCGSCQKVRSLPPGFLFQLEPVRREYLVLGRLIRIAEKTRAEMMRAQVLEKLVDYSADDRIPVRQSAVAAAGKVLDHLDRRDEIEALESAGSAGNSGGGGFTLSINIAAMIGGGVGNNGISEVIDAKP